MPLSLLRGRVPAQAAVLHDVTPGTGAELGVPQDAFVVEPRGLQGTLLGEVLDVGPGLESFDQRVLEQIACQGGLCRRAVTLAAMGGQQGDPDVERSAAAPMAGLLRV